MTTFIAFLALSKHGSDPFDRYQQFVKSHPNFKATFTTTLNKVEILTGTMLVERPNRMLMTCEHPGGVYTASSTENSYLEIERSNKSYDENPPTRILSVIPSRISGASSAAPSLILMPDVKGAIPKPAKVTSTVSGDQIYATAQNRMGKIEVWMTINDLGEITDLKINKVDQGHTIDQSWKITYELDKPLSLADFQTPIPAGFFPYALPRTEMPIQKGQLLPVKGWIQHHSKTPVNLLDLAGSKPFLLAILSNDGPSLRSLASLKSLSKQLPVLEVGGEGLSDPSGILLAKLNCPGTPMFFLADGTGKVIKLWYGYDPDHKASFESDVLTSRAEDSKSR